MCSGEYGHESRDDYSVLEMCELFLRYLKLKRQRKPGRARLLRQGEHQAKNHVFEKRAKMRFCAEFWTANPVNISLLSGRSLGGRRRNTKLEIRGSAGKS